MGRMPLPGAVLRCTAVERNPSIGGAWMSYSTTTTSETGPALIPTFSYRSSFSNTVVRSEVSTAKFSPHMDPAMLLATTDPVAVYLWVKVKTAALARFLVLGFLIRRPTLSLCSAMQHTLKQAPSSRLPSHRRLHPLFRPEARLGHSVGLGSVLDEEVGACWMEVAMLGEELVYPGVW
ncbi:hypothetical protein Hypma_004090 [Hypsizygus marmoreus]|uniref:Uncharacterized protein n=1 Tax=Hypsizygus marmoreus TaxID=39966 RepID=A0A369JYN8_HYPMA|nr:hypothetical protein Hypma_004090 [Hypsizygus marmoreus]